MSENQVVIDLEKENFNFYELQNRDAITAIRFINYTDKIEIPLDINDFSKITQLSFHGKNLQNRYESPDNLAECIHIKSLIFWGNYDFNKMQQMPQLQELDTTLKNMESDSRNIANFFPNLKKLTIGWCIDGGKLAVGIENLKYLECFHMVNCGNIEFPDSFAKLQQLKDLSLRLTMTTVPEIICQLENLESLELLMPITNLPDCLVNLKNLKNLNLHSALNGANMDVAGSFLEEKIYLKPIPDVIGKLINLEDLNLGICGVFDLTPILSLQKLKKLNLQYSALKNCDDFSNFKMLEDLNLKTSYDLKNLDGLKGLPLKKLNLSSNYNPSIEVISSLELLENLNIRGCSSIKDYSPLYNHKSITELEADSEIFKKWQKREQFKKLPSIDLIISELETNDVLQFEDAILHLSKHVDANYSDDNNPLAGYFNIETQDEEITHLEVLDTAIQKHIKNLSDETLAIIFGMTFKSVGFDNYNAALCVLEEIIARKNIETQKTIIKKFNKACKCYDAGHRFWGYTVHDQLIDTYFSQFTSEALYILLKKASTDMLNSEGGDAMDELFVPAFQNTNDKKLQKKLLDVFFKYEEEARTYFGKGYFDAILQQIKDIAPPDLENLILAKKEENKEKEIWLNLLDNLNKENLPDVIEHFVNQIRENFDEEDLYKIVDASKKISLPGTSLVILLDFIIEKDKKNYLESLLVAKYHKNSPEKIIDFLKEQLEKSHLKIIDLFNITKSIITELIVLNVPFEELKIYEEFIISHCNVSSDKIYNIEVQTLLRKFFKHDSYRSDQDISWVLEKIKAISLRMEGEITYNDLRFDTYLLMDSGEYERVKQVFDVLYPKTKELKEQGVLFYNIIAAIKLNDESYFNLLFKEVQQLKKITEVLLAYNLSCAFAHFGRKDEMLFYIKESIRLGKMKQQFLDDADFEKYWKDVDFLEVIEEK